MAKTKPRKFLHFLFIFVLASVTAGVTQDLKNGYALSGPQLLISPQPLYFGHIPRGKVALRDLLLYNIGTSTLNINAMRIEGKDASFFSFAENPGSATLELAQLLVVSIKFEPDTEDSVSAKVVIESNSNSSPDVVELTGKGTNLSKGFISFERIFGRPDGSSASSVQVTGDGGFIISGSTVLLDADYNDAALIKTDAYGQVEWSQWYGLEEWSEGFSAGIPTSNGGYIAAGSHSYTDRLGEPDVYVVKTDETGNLVWEKSYGRSEFKPDGASDIIATSDGDFLIAGSSQTGANTDAYLIKIDPNGDVVWEKTYGGTGGDNASSIKETSDGGYVFVGSTSTNSIGGANDFDFYLVKIDASGNVQWEKTFGGTDWDKAGSVIITKDGGYLMAGYTASPEFGAVARDVFLVKADAAGNEEWHQLYGWEHKDGASEVIAVDDGGYLIVGGTERYYDAKFETWRSDVYVIKTDASGNELWSKTYGGLHEEAASDVRQTNDGGFIVCCNTRSYSKSRSVYLLKLDKQGNFATPVIMAPAPAPLDFRLSQNYPNPFNSRTKITYRLPKSSHVQIKIFNVQGRLIQTLVDEDRQAGVYSVHWNANDFASGLYFYQITAANLTATKRMLLLK